MKSDFAIIIHCFNIEKRFAYNNFLIFARRYPHVTLFFIDNGSTDRTAGIIRTLIKEQPGNITVYSVQQRLPKPEACRLGIIRLYGMSEIAFLGLLDPEHSGKLESLLNFAKLRFRNPFLPANQETDNRTGTDCQSNCSGGLPPQYVEQFLLLHAAQSPWTPVLFERRIIPALFSSKFLTRNFANGEVYLRIKRNEILAEPEKNKPSLAENLPGIGQYFATAYNTGILLRIKLMILRIRYLFVLRGNQELLPELL